MFVGGDAWYCCLDHPAVSLRSNLRLSFPLERGKTPTREDSERLVDHAYELLKQEPSAAPTLLTYKPTSSPDDVWSLASILLESHRVICFFLFLFFMLVLAWEFHMCLTASPVSLPFFDEWEESTRGYLGMARGGVLTGGDATVRTGRYHTAAWSFN